MLISRDKKTKTKQVIERSEFLFQGFRMNIIKPFIFFGYMTYVRKRAIKIGGKVIVYSAVEFFYDGYCHINAEYNTWRY